MSVRKVKGLESEFTIVPNKAINDSRLSWAARGMLLYLCSKPEDWNVTISDLSKQTSGSSRKSGRDAVRAIMKELIEFGYMRKTQKRVSGKFDNCDHEVCFEPWTENPSTANPSTAHPTQQSKDLTKDRVNKENISGIRSGTNVAIEDYQYSLPNCEEMLRVMDYYKDKGFNLYTGGLTEEEWNDAELEMDSIDCFDHVGFMAYWIEHHYTSMRKAASLSDIISPKNGIDFEQYYNAICDDFDL